MLADLHQHLALNLAAIIATLALACRNQIKLRTVLLASLAVSIVDHGFAAGGPAWDELFWNAVTLVINSAVLINLVLDRTHVGLSAQEEHLFQAFGSLSPGEFRKLLKLATWKQADDHVVLTREDETPDQLFYVLDGTIEIEKSGRCSTFLAPTFIGEVAFIKERAASATVTLAPGGRYLAWDAASLHRSFTRHQDMRVATIRLLSADMASKVARA